MPTRRLGGQGVTAKERGQQPGATEAVSNYSMVGNHYTEESIFAGRFPFGDVDDRTNTYVHWSRYDILRASEKTHLGMHGDCSRRVSLQRDRAKTSRCVPALSSAAWKPGYKACRVIELTGNKLLCRVGHGYDNLNSATSMQISRNSKP